MIVTEEEAKTKRCQETFSASSGFTKPGGADDDMRRCIGTGCMSWRWLEGTALDLKGAPLKTYALGYCGKAGKP